MILSPLTPYPLYVIINIDLTQFQSRISKVFWLSMHLNCHQVARPPHRDVLPYKLDGRKTPPSYLLCL